MKQFALLFFSTLLISSCYQQERNCVDFHTGTFEFETFLDGELVTTTFIRNDSIEIDFFRGKVDTASIRWINDCEYIVQKLSPKNMAEKKAIHMKILTTDKNIYTFEYGLVDSNNKQRGTAKKIK
ncbi:hypothetical protein ATO12_01150 [Aquimarina atlantica]|uniref:DNA topoisomerase IV subunit A n=1 Tax=Aquimarina atlantica TaxID=1317122 RepID=A0A023BZM4_9FLAO|nr:hypothetical protein [Aquimarina atlantica]EZH75414.1 hypothetical protein ATO12_01150 [Aquimarina atlantica]